MTPVKLAAWTFLASVSLAQTCYWPAGNTGQNLLPCGTTAADSTNSACCYQEHYCLSNGLCFEPRSMTTYRGGCTDQSFKSPSCSSYCYGNSPDYGVSVGTQHAGVWACSVEKYACDLSLCSTKSFTIPAAKMVTNAALRADVANLTVESTATTTIRVSTCASTTIRVSTCASTRAPTKTAAPVQKKCDEGISAGSAAGIGLGVGAPLATAAAVLLVLLLRERRKTRSPNKPELEAVPREQGTPSWLSPYGPVSGHQGYEGRAKDAPNSEIMGAARHEMAT